MQRLQQYVYNSCKDHLAKSFPSKPNRFKSSGPSQQFLKWETDGGSSDPVFKNLKWNLVTTEYACDQVTSFLLSKIDDKSYVGFDIEWDAMFHKNQTSPTALLQLGVHTGHCLLFQVRKINFIPTLLRKVLTDPDILKVGVGIQDDVMKIKNDFGVQMEGWFDLRTIAPVTLKTGLAALTQHHLNTVLPKNKKIVTSKWSEELSLKKQAYAARDAYVATLLLPKLVAKKLEIPESSVTQNDIVNLIVTLKREIK